MPVHGKITMQIAYSNWPFEYSKEDAGIVLDDYIGPGLQLMEQSLEIDGRTIKLIVPRSSDAVLDYYINAGEPDSVPLQLI